MTSFSKSHFVPEAVYRRIDFAAADMESVRARTGAIVNAAVVQKHQLAGHQCQHVALHRADAAGPGAGIGHVIQRSGGLFVDQIAIDRRIELAIAIVEPFRTLTGGIVNADNSIQIQGYHQNSPLVSFRDR